MVAFQIGQMRSLFIVCQMRTNSIRHYHNEAAIIHVQPIAFYNWEMGHREEGYEETRVVDLRRADPKDTRSKFSA
jgi:hypothetical protein